MSATNNDKEHMHYFGLEEAHGSDRDESDSEFAKISRICSETWCRQKVEEKEQREKRTNKRRRIVKIFDPLAGEGRDSANHVDKGVEYK